MQMSKPILGMDLADLGEAIGAGHPAYRARQLYQAVYREGASDLHNITTLPAGMKKLVEAVRSINCMMIAASNGGKASTNRNAVTNWAHTKNGNRIQVSPGASNWMMVVMKLIAPSSEDVIRKINPVSQSVWPLKKGLKFGPLSAITESGV